MFRKRHLLGLTLSAVLLLACEEDALVPPDLTLDNPEAFVIDGNVRFVDVEGGCWVIQTADGARYEPYPLPKEFARDGLRVRAAVVELGIFTTCQVGIPVEVVEIGRYR